MHTVLICRNYQTATAQLPQLRPQLIDDSDYQNTRIPELLRIQISGNPMEQEESESIGCRLVMSKTRPPKNARATQDSCVPGHHYHRGSLDMFS